jgi:hypothetical protein
MKATITIEVPDDMDMEHTLECVTDALYYADCITAKEEDLIIQILQAIRKQKRNEITD